MNPFSFTNVPHIVFGRGAIEQLTDLLAPWGQRVMMITNAGEPGDGGLIDSVRQRLTEAGIVCECFRQRGEPRVEDVEQAVQAARAAECDSVIGLGGGGAIDAAKAVAGLLSNGGGPLDYMEVIGAGQPLRVPAAPWVAIPTTAGTGAEVTRNAVLGCPERGFKASLRSEHLLAKVALVDPDLGVTVRPEITARSGMDALCQVIESYASNKANPFSDALALKGITAASQALRRAYDDGMDLQAREDMALAALLSGITLSNVGLGAVHGFAAPACAKYPIPHGTLCAVLLPHVMEANIEILSHEDPDGDCLRRYADIGRALTQQPALEDTSARQQGVDTVRALVTHLQIPSLREFQFRQEEFGELCELAKKASSMRYNPVTLPDEVLLRILQQAW